MNYLQLCQELTTELGIAGAEGGGEVPAAVTGQTGQLANVVNWIARANDHVNNLHKDWRFLWTTYSESLVVSDRDAPANSNSSVSVRQWDRRSFWLNKAQDTQNELRYVPWQQFRRTFEPGTHPEAGMPQNFSVKPDQSIVLDTPPDQAYTMTAEFWRRPARLESEGDTPMIPEDYHRIIVVGAGMLYGGKEAAPEVISYMSAEYATLLEQLRADQLAGHEHDTMSEVDEPILVEVPGYADVNA